MTGGYNSYSDFALLVDNTDEAWGRRDTWVWTRTPLFANDYVCAFACGDSVQQAGLKAAP